MELTTPRLLLRPFREEDAEALYAYARNPRVGRAAGWKPHESAAESLEVIRTVFCGPHVFALTERESGRLIGAAGFTGGVLEETPAPQDEIGYSLSPEFWGRGLMTEAAEALLDFGFGDRGLAAVWCNHYEENHRSRRVIEKYGFRYLYTRDVRDEPSGALRPACFYLLTREEWAARRERGEGGHDGI